MTDDEYRLAYDPFELATLGSEGAAVRTVQEIARPDEDNQAEEQKDEKPTSERPLNL